MGTKVGDELRSTWVRKDVLYTMFLVLPIAGAGLSGLLYSVDPIDDSYWAGDYDKWGGTKEADLLEGKIALWAERSYWSVDILVRDPEGTEIINRSTANITETIASDNAGIELVYIKVGSFEVDNDGTYAITANNSAKLYITRNITQTGFLSYMGIGALVGAGMSVAMYHYLFKKRKVPEH